MKQRSSPIRNMKARAPTMLPIIAEVLEDTAVGVALEVEVVVGPFKSALSTYDFSLWVLFAERTYFRRPC